MNDGRDALTSGEVRDTEASANTPMNDASAPAHHNPMPSENQNTQPSRPLSSRIDQLNATIAPGGDHSSSTYIESSERGSDISIKGRPDHSAPTNSLSSHPISPVNGTDQTRLDKPILNGHTPAPGVEPEPLDSQIAPPKPANGGASIDRWQPSLSPIKAGNASISPPPSPEHPRTRSHLDAQWAPGQKRTAAGHFKSTLDSSAVHDVDVNGARRRSKSTGSAYGNRIAQLSVHIRTRLSYAAAKVEQARQSREATPQSALRAHSSASPPSDIVSLPAGFSTPFSQDSQPSSSNGNPSHFPNHSRSRSAFSSNQYLPIPKLAPPVDIVSSSNTQRRRPNPDAISKPSNHSPIFRHRRHHSNQDNGLSRSLNGSVLGPGTSSSHTHPPKSTPNGFYRPTQTPNTAMEQDAIETLMFMSSPENSGYRFSPRPLQTASTQSSLNESISNSSANNNGSQSSQTSESHGRGFETKPGLEAHAGDDIDRLLDQMDSDSEDEGRYASHRSVITGSQPFRGTQPR
ncbi:uncharacterized protein N7515_005845 [Penicillium bovifimosum]|uniref:Uncharacterized protein n=1 Tax=Penicillium bovifimosum TaxID=126998 RepID=A0A9W9GUX0_9EURO|nr:uncharacterized protein N7515_005845 [Penicillium bovifimosum]KAJ5129806.1 hypothetical protein N7515_005845 [Penicillium bovifimosum]